MFKLKLNTMLDINFTVTLMLATAIKLSFGAKNVLLIIADDLRPALGGYEDKNAYTPNIDQLIREGVVFQDAFAQQALCAPSRNSFLTSRRPDTLRLYDFYNYWRTFAGNFTTLPQYFKENKYETKSIGKIFHPGISSNFTDDYPLSWSHPPWHPSSEVFKNSPVCFSNNGWFTNLVCPVRVAEQPGRTLPDIESLEEATTFLKSKIGSNKPFLLAVGFHKPHIPLKFPIQFLDYHPLDKVILPQLRQYPPGLPEVAWNPWTDIRWRHDISLLNLSFPYQKLPDNWAKLIKQSYYASVSFIDTLVGKLMNILKVTSLDNNTIVVFISDHGWSLGEHGEWSKYSNFDVALRVPFIIRIPNLTYSSKNKYDNQNRSGIRCNEIVELVDLFPTIVDLVGLESIPFCPKNSQNIKLCTEGKSLVPLIHNEVLKKHKRKKIKYNSRALSQYPRPGFFPTRCPNSDKPKLRDIKIMGYSQIRTKRFRYTEWIGWNHSTFKGNWSNIYSTEMYDHVFDPNENLNIAGRSGLEEVQKKLDGMSYGIVSGLIIGAALGALHAKIVKAHSIKPFVMNTAVNNAIFGGSFFGLLTAYGSCWR